MKITKEQVRKLYNMVEMHGYDYIQPTIKEWFPKAFEPKLEVGKWYECVGGEDGDVLFCLTSINGAAYGYGFCDGKWTDYTDGNGNWCMANKYWIKKLKPASSIDVERALLKEAEKRGYKKGVKVRSLRPTNCESEIIDFWNISSEGNMWFCGDDYNIVVFRDGKWAEIIESTPATKLTVAEIESKLGYKIEVISEP